MGRYWIDGREVTREEYDNSLLPNTPDEEVEIPSKEDGQANEQPVKKSIITPYIVGFFGMLLIVLLLYMINSINTEADDIMKLYSSLQDKTTDSKEDFDKVLRYIAVDASGNLIIKVEYESELNKGEEEDDEFSGSSENGGGWNGDSLALNAMDMYDHFTYTGKGSVVTSLTHGVNLYDGIPWEDDGTWYVLDIESVDKYCETNLGQGMQGDTGFHTDDYNDVAVTKDGVACAGIAWVPIYSFLDFTEEGTFSPNWGSGIAQASNAYGVVILEKNGSTFYLPIGSGGDNKGHTWPGGLVQTYIGHGTRINGNQITFNSGGSTDQAKLTWNGTRMHNMTISVSEFLGNWKTACEYNNYTIGLEHPSMTVELTSTMKRCLSGYEILGFIIHKGD